MRNGRPFSGISNRDALGRPIDAQADRDAWLSPRKHTWETPPFRATLKGKTIELEIGVDPKERKREERTLRCDASAILIMTARFWGATRSPKSYAVAPAALPSYSECAGYQNNTGRWYENIATHDDFEPIVLKLARVKIRSFR